MTRGMVNTVLARLAGVDTTPSAGQKWYEVGKTCVAPGADAQRAQVAAMMARYLKNAG